MMTRRSCLPTGSPSWWKRSQPTRASPTSESRDRRTATMTRYSPTVSCTGRTSRSVRPYIPFPFYPHVLSSGLKVFGHLFPPYFKNWWSDDWISTVYGAAHTFLVSEVQIKHNVGAQKTKGTTRYEVDKAAQLHLEEELRKGYVQVWINVDIG